MDELRKLMERWRAIAKRATCLDYNIAMTECADELEAALAAIPAGGWRDIASAPRDGSPIWFRGWDWGKPDTTRHAGWAYWNGGAWQWAQSGGVASYASEWLAASPPLAASRAGENDE